MQTLFHGLALRLRSLDLHSVAPLTSSRCPERSVLPQSKDGFLKQRLFSVYLPFDFAPYMITPLTSPRRPERSVLTQSKDGFLKQRLFSVYLPFDFAPRSALGRSAQDGEFNKAECSPAIPFRRAR